MAMGNERASNNTHIKRPFPQLNNLSDYTHGAPNILRSIQGDCPLHNEHTRRSRGRTGINPTIEE